MERRGEGGRDVHREKRGEVRGYGEKGWERYGEGGKR